MLFFLTGAERGLNAASSSFFLRMKTKFEAFEKQSYKPLHCFGRLRTFKQEELKGLQISVY